VVVRLGRNRFVEKASELLRAGKEGGGCKIVSVHAVKPCRRSCGMCVGLLMFDVGPRWT
jgi:dihydropteroate synthase